jgi:hypothetical protein
MRAGTRLPLSFRGLGDRDERVQIDCNSQDQESAADEHEPEKCQRMNANQGKRFH